MTFCTCSLSLDPKSTDYSSFTYFYLYVDRYQKLLCRRGKNEVHAVSILHKCYNSCWMYSLPQISSLFMYVASDNFVRMNPSSCQQRPSVQEKSPTGCLLLLLLSPHKQSRAKWSFVVWKCISWPGLLIYLFFIISLLATDVVTHDCRGLAGRNIRVLLIRLVAFGASWLEFSFFLFCV